MRLRAHSVHSVNVRTALAAVLPTDIPAPSSRAHHLGACVCFVDQINCESHRDYRSPCGSAVQHGNPLALCISARSTVPLFSYHKHARPVVRFLLGHPPFSRLTLFLRGRSLSSVLCCPCLCSTTNQLTNQSADVISISLGPACRCVLSKTSSSPMNECGS